MFLRTGKVLSVLPFLKRYCANRMERLRREDDGKGRQVKKAQDAEQSLLSKVRLDFQDYVFLNCLIVSD